MKSASRMGLVAALAVALSGGSAMGEYALSAKAMDYSGLELLPRRRSARKTGGYRGKRHDARRVKRPNMNHVSKRVRRKHRRAKRSVG